MKHYVKLYKLNKLFVFVDFFSPWFGIKRHSEKRQSLSSPQGHSESSYQA